MTHPCMEASVLFLRHYAAQQTGRYSQSQVTVVSKVLQNGFACCQVAFWSTHSLDWNVQESQSENVNCSLDALVAF